MIVQGDCDNCTHQIQDGCNMNRCVFTPIDPGKVIPEPQPAKEVMPRDDGEEKGNAGGESGPVEEGAPGHGSEESQEVTAKALRKDGEKAPDQDAPLPPEAPLVNKCLHQLLGGPRKGSLCGKDCKPRKTFCPTHDKKH